MPGRVGFARLVKHRDFTHLPTSFKRFRYELNRKDSKFER
jgi:hypothetical protein